MPRYEPPIPERQPKTISMKTAEEILKEFWVEDNPHKVAFITQAMQQYAEMVSEDKLAAMIDYLREKECIVMELPTRRYVELFLTQQKENDGK